MDNLELRRSLELFERAARRIPGGSQTTSKRPSKFAFGGYPIYAERGRGGRILDLDGNEYIDLVQALGPIVLGYAYPATDAALLDQLENGFLYGLMSPLEVNCAELICDVVPCAEMVRFFKGGGEATAAAARTVRGFTGREVILNAGYRGWPDVWGVLASDPGVPAALGRSTLAFRKYDLDDLHRLFLEHKGHVAAVFIDIDREEPPAGYLLALKELCHRHGALLVFDEVVTGFRLALGGAQEYFGTTPDLACFAKAMANGMPLACVAGRADVMASMADRFVSITYGGEALSLAVSIATIREIQARNVTAYLWRLGRRLREGLNRAARDSGISFLCDGLDPMTVMQFTDAPAHGASPTDGTQRCSGGKQDALKWEFFLQEMAVRGVLMNRGGPNFINFSHSEAEIDQVVKSAREVFALLRSSNGVSDLYERVWSRKSAG